MLNETQPVPSMDQRMFNFLLLLIFCLNTYASIFELLENQKNNANNKIRHTLTRMVQEIFPHYFFESRCVSIITETSEISVNGARTGALTLKTSFSKIEGSEVLNKAATFPRMKNQTVDEMLLESLNARCECFLIQVQNCEEFIKRILYISRKATQRLNRKYLFLPKTEDSNCLSVLSMKEMDFIPDVVVACIKNTTIDSDIKIDLFTHRFVGKGNESILLDVWDSVREFHRRGDIFPDKISNLKGKQLVYSSFHYPPYGVVLKGNDTITYDGTETRLVLELARMLNASWTIVIDEENEWGEIFENETGNGILGSVVEDRSDVGFGALYQWHHEYLHLDFSFPYIRTGVTCLAPRPKRLPGWMSVVLPFSPGMWVGVGSSLVVATAAHHLVFKASLRLTASPDDKFCFRDNLTLVDCAVIIVGLLVCQVPSNEEREIRVRDPERHLISWLLVLFLLVSSSYSGGLASILTVPKFEAPIDTVSDLAASNIPWAATHEAWVFSLRNTTDPITSHVYHQFRVMKKEELEILSTKGQIAFSLERLPAGHYAIGNYIDEEAVSTLRVMSQDLYWEQCVTAVRKGSPYLDALNKLVHRLLDSGLLLYWEGAVVRRFLSNRVQRAVRQSSATVSQSGPTQLVLEHVQGAYIILGIGLVLSVLVFAREMMTCDKYSMKTCKTDKLKKARRNLQVRRGRWVQK